MRPEPLVFGFDTSAAHCAAALLSGDQILASRGEEMGTGQAERLIPMLEEVLAEAGAGWRDLAAIGVGVGPGNFTGVRISVAAARGLALALGIPAIGVTRLEALAHGLPRPLAVVEDARRGEVYVQGFDPAQWPPGPPGADDGRNAAGDPLLLDLSDLPDALGGLPLTGSAAAAAAALTGGPVLAPAMPLAEAVARIAATRLDRPQPRPAPLYLRAADAAPPSDPPPRLIDA